MTEEIKASVKEIIQRTPGVTSIRVFHEGLRPFKPGQFMQVILKPGVKDYARWLSISNSPTERGYLEFTKKITESGFSKGLKSLRINDRLLIRYPFGKFTFEGECERIAYLSGGIGITPIRSMVKYIVDKKLRTDVYLFYANRTEADIAFKEDFDKMQSEHPNVKVEHVLSQAAASWQGRRGVINAETIKDCLPDYRQRKFYICGPPGMVKAMRELLAEDLKIKQDSIITENFTGY